MNLNEYSTKNGKQFVNTASEKLRIAMIKKGIKTSKLASLMNCSASNMTNHLKRNNFSERDLRLIADSLGYDVEITLISRETGEKI